MASLPAVAPAPKMAALPNFLLAFLSHSPCWGFASALCGIFQVEEAGMGKGYLWVLGVGGLVGI